MSFLSDLASPATLRRAWERVAAKRGVAGIDRMSVADFGADLDANLRRLAEEIASSRYRPVPVLRLRPPFLATADRALVVPAVRDRVVQRAISDLLAPAVEPTLSSACRAFRKGGSAVAAADDVSRWIEAGNPWVLRADVKSFFDSIDPDLLREKLAPFVDAEGLRFLDRVLRCRVFDHEQVTEMVDGIPQGSPLSPLLGNLYLSELDAAVHARHPHYLRYCDDLIVLEPEEAEVRGARDEVARQLAAVRLVLNDDKTRVCRAEDGFVFLGYHFGAAGRGPAAKAVEALHFRLGELARAEPFAAAEVDSLYRGWSSYFGVHPECWTDSPVGLLAVLRARGAAAGGDAGGIEPLIAARWQQAEDPAPQLALDLGRAWTAAGREEQSWLEWATACAGSRADRSTHEPWSELLGTPAEELASLARRLTGPPSERAAVLAESLTEAGRFEAASRLAAVAAAYAAAPEPSAPAAEDLAAIADYRLLEAFFQGREGVHAVVTAGRSGQRRFTPVHQPIATDEWRAHLRGETTLALPLVRAGNTALLGVLDVDVERRALDQRLGRAEELLGRALGAALRLRGELERRGCRCLLELSGYKGYHLWIRLDEPVPCFALRRWLLDVIQAAGPLPEGIRVEEFPNRDRVRPDAITPVVKLPLGVHAKTGKRCVLLDQRGEPLADPFEAIRLLPRLSARVIRDAAAELETDQATGGATPGAASPAAAIGPRAQLMLDGCHVLAYLARRAEETSYLNHRERSSLLCTLGHLGEEGAAALHAIIGHTYNYRPEVTDRHLARLPSHPMSCPKLKELHPEAAALVACRCDFPLRPGRGYPTPLLFALKPGEIPAFRKPPPAPPPGEPPAARASSPAPPASRPATTSAAELQHQAEEKVKKLGELHRHRRGVEASIQRLHRELAELFEAAATDALDLPTGRLRRLPRADGEGWDFVVEI